MTVTININGLTLCHRASGGITHNTLPDVCMTPEKGVPEPFDNEAYSKDLANGTSTVFADGGNMIGNFGSIFATSILDEGGSYGGIVSGTVMAEADFITHSFDVFFEGKPACRLTDKMWMNHRNTVNMAGLDQIKLRKLRKQIQDWVCECQDQVKPTKDDGSAKTCMELGTDQHQCMEDKKAADNKENERQGKKPRHGQEKGYKVENGKISKVDDIAKRRLERPAALKQAADALNKKIDQHTRVRAGASMAKRFIGRRGGRGGAGADVLGDTLGSIILEGQIANATREIEEATKVLERAEQAAQNPNNLPRHKGHTYPDGAILDDDGKIAELSEYKFVCPEDTPTGKTNKKTGLPSVSKGDSEGPWAPGQDRKYRDLLDAMKTEGLSKSDAEPKKYSSADCKKTSSKGKK